MTKNISLGVAAVLIIGAIWYLQAGKVRPDATVKGDVLTEVSTPADVDLVPDISADGTLSAKAKQEQTASPTSTLKTPASVASKTERTISKAEKAKKYKSAREIIPGGGFINTEPFKLKDYIGKKVILLDFWTYSCINCQRTTPYLNAWYQKYKDQGLVIVGVHTPEFDFEKVYDNVANAVKDEGIKYPVVQDNAYATWQTYENRFWPRKYLIDIDGYIIYDHIGEGAYDETERLIQEALKERAHVLGTKDAVPSGISSPTDVISFDSEKTQSPETYFGSARNEYLANGDSGAPGTQTLSIPQSISSNKLYLGGIWKFNSEYAESQGKATITYKFKSSNVYLVASSASGVKVTVLIDGKPIGTNAGADVGADGTVTIKENRLYKLVHMPDYGEHTLELQVEGSGFDAYAFTFG